MGELTLEEQLLSEQAVRFVKENADILIQKFCAHIPTEDVPPTTIFTAGSPGAGKTEFARRIIAAMQKDRGAVLAHIDADEIRAMLPNYTNSNSYIFQKAISEGVNKIFDHVLKAKKSCVLDGTFSHFSIAHTNIERCVKRGRVVAIAYLREDPVRAWNFTQAREKVEGRRILKDTFIEQFFAAQEVVMKIKKEFGSRIELWDVQKDYVQNSYIIQAGVEAIDLPAQSQYSKEKLIELL